MYQIIRAASDYCLVIIATPPGSAASTPGPDSKFFRFASWQIHDHAPCVWNEISADTALGYFSGHADHFGGGEIPDQPFTSLDEALNFVTERYEKAAKALLKKMRAGMKAP
jgi:hypothetical protein